MGDPGVEAARQIVDRQRDAEDDRFFEIHRFGRVEVGGFGILQDSGQPVPPVRMPGQLLLQQRLNNDPGADRDGDDHADNIAYGWRQPGGQHFSRYPADPGQHKSDKRDDGTRQCRYFYISYTISHADARIIEIGGKRDGNRRNPNSQIHDVSSFN
ncbi:hypothetical protein BGX30_014878 [Mortierella sp. GBA39]|nr:hypothetical protein BGX30_014878 [Mortierella sp. GBA39]